MTTSTFEHSTTSTFVVRPIEAEVLDVLRRGDDLGHEPLLMVEQDGGSPLRCCLRLSQPGEEIALVSYAPLRRWAVERQIEVAAYDEVGPIFIHATSCGGPQGDGFPTELRGAPRMLRAYSHNGRILSGTIVEADGPFEQTVDELLANPEVAVVHGRALAFGCFTFEICRN